MESAIATVVAQLLLAALAPVVLADARATANFIILMTDDQGWSDSGYAAR